MKSSFMLKNQELSYDYDEDVEVLTKAKMVAHIYLIDNYSLIDLYNLVNGRYVQNWEWEAPGVW